MSKIKLYEGETGDMSVVILAWAKTKAKAIEIMNKEYKKHLDDGSGFVFDEDSVTVVNTPKKSGIFKSYSLL